MPVRVLWFFLAAPLVCLQCVIVVFPDHSHLLFVFIVWSLGDCNRRTCILCSNINRQVCIFVQVYAHEWRYNRQICVFCVLSWQLKSMGGCVFLYLTTISIEGYMHSMFSHVNRNRLLISHGNGNRQLVYDVFSRHI